MGTDEGRRAAAEDGAVEAHGAARGRHDHHRHQGSLCLPAFLHARARRASGHPAGLDARRARERYPPRHGRPVRGEDEGRQAWLAGDAAACGEVGLIDLVDFRDKIAAKLAAEGCDAAVLFGRAHLLRQDNQGPGTANRVVIAPGEPDSDDMGVIKVATKSHVRAYPGEATHAETVTIDVWAYDGSAPADEAVQYRAWRVLWNRVVRAVGACIRDGKHTSTWWDSSV